MLRRELAKGWISPKLVIWGVILVFLFVEPFPLPFPADSARAATTCIISPADGVNQPGICDFTFNYFDRPLPGQAGVVNAGLLQCGWEIWSYNNPIPPSVCNASTSCVITRHKPDDSCPNAINGGPETIRDLNIGSAGDCRSTGSPGCSVWAWAYDRATGANSGQQYFDLNIALNRPPSCVSLSSGGSQPSCTESLCAAWANSGACGTGGCSSDQKPQARTCPTGSTCSISQCVYDAACGSPPPAGTSKLGLQLSCGNQNYWDFIDAHPKVVKLMNDFSCAAGIKSRSSSTFIVGRIYNAGQPTDGDPEARAQQWFNANKNTFLNNSSVDCWEGYNEEDGGGSVAGMQWIGRFEAERVKQLASISRKACIGNFGGGGPTAPEEDSSATWAAFRPALEAAKTYGGYLGLHEYSAPDMKCLFDSGAGEGWLTGRYRKVYRDYLIPNNLAIPLVVTETGLARDLCNQQSACGCAGQYNRDDVGWRAITGVSSQSYFDGLKWYDSLLKQDNYVIGATIFISGNNDWSTFETAAELTGANGLLTNYLKGVSGTVTGYSPLVVRLQASASDPDNDSISEYEFDFGDGVKTPAGNSSNVASHVYTTAGNYCAKVRVKDNQGAWSTNTGQCGTGNVTCVESVIVSQETTPPVTSIKCNGTACSAGWYSADISVTLSCADSGSGCKTTYYCSDRSGSCAPSNVYNGAFTVSSNGTSYVRYYSKDNANNTETTKVQSLKLDKIPPVTAISCNGGACSDGWYAASVSVALSCNDGVGSGCQNTYYCLSQTNGCSPTVVYTGTFSAFYDGLNYVRYYSKDNTNNSEAIKTRLVKIDRVVPTVGQLYIGSSQAGQLYPIQVQRGRNNTFKADATDNAQVSSCDLYFTGSADGAMSLLPAGCTTSCRAERLKTFNNKANYPNSHATCRDAAGNVASGADVRVEVVDLGVNLNVSPTTGTPASKFTLTSTATGEMTGTINFHFDCQNDGSWEAKYDAVNTLVSDSSWVSRTDFYGRVFQTKRTSPDTFAVKDLCQYASPNTYSLKAFIERGSGSAENTASLTVSANSPPDPGFSCDASSCGAGSSSTNCIGYQGCILKADNLSSDPNGLTDIQTVEWTVKDKLTGVVKDQLSCPSDNILCNYTIPSILPAKIYNVVITVSDASNASRSYNRDVVLRRDISADFVCSLNPTDSTSWKPCDSLDFRPPSGSLVYFHDNLSDGILNLLGLTGRKTVLSEGATKITRRTWKKDGVTFDVCNRPAGCANSNPSTNIDGTLVTLDVEDDSGRGAASQSEITTELPSPEWEEIAPF